MVRSIFFDGMDSKKARPNPDQVAIKGFGKILLEEKEKLFSFS
jgi:hypothetical protein